MRRKFKPGDRLKLIDDSAMGATKGAIAVVQDPAYFHGGKYINVIWIRDELAGGQCNGLYYPRMFDLAYEANCLYCGGSVERSDKYIICTECYRVQDDT